MTTLADYLRDLLIEYDERKEGEDVETETIREEIIEEYLDIIKSSLIGE